MPMLHQGMPQEAQLGFLARGVLLTGNARRFLDRSLTWLE
jgi:hypothetical protein